MNTGLPPGEQTLAGLLWAISGVMFATLLLSLPKIVGPGISPFQVVFFRYFFGLAVIAPFFAMGAAGQANMPVLAPWRLTRLHVLRAAMALARISAFVYAITRMPFANAQAVTLTNGVFMMIFAGAILKERVNRVTAAAAVICFSGALIAAEPSSDLAFYLTPGALAALFGAAIWGLESVVIRYTAERDRIERTLFVVNAAASLLVLLPALLVWQPMSLQSAAVLALMGPLAILTQVSNMRAFRAARASLLAPVRYTAVIFALFVGFFGFGEWPSPLALAGIGLVAAGGILLTVTAAHASLRTMMLKP